MTHGAVGNADLCLRAVSALKERRPSSYAPLLDFYGKMFSLQEEALFKVDVPAIDLETGLLAAKARSYFPLISVGDFKFDPGVSRDLCIRICQLSDSAEDGLRAAARRFKAAIDKDALQLEDLFAGLLTENSEMLNLAAGKMNMEAPSLVFLCYHSIRPSIVRCASQLQGFLDPHAEWPKGYCPICGSPPGLSVLDDAGKRAMACGFCWHQWRVNRGQCLFCENQDRKSQHYFYSEAEKEYRVETCDACKTYLKTIDMRLVDRPLYLPLEQVATLHLDIKAQELGFESNLKIDVGEK
jgi:FdhE protein